MLSHANKSEKKTEVNQEVNVTQFKTGYLQDNRTKTILQKKKNDTGLPDNLKSGIENLSGYSMDGVKVHYNSSQPAQLHAHAYAQGTNIHLAPGQEKHLPHEAWHVVQQKQGRVKPTMQLKGKINVNDDEGLEKEADIMGSQALQLKLYNGQKKLVFHTPLYSLTAQRKPGDLARLSEHIGHFIKFSVDGRPAITGQITAVDSVSATIGGIKYSRTKINGSNFIIQNFSETQEGLPPVHNVAASVAAAAAAAPTIDDHMGEFAENFATGNNPLVTRTQIAHIAESTTGVGKNFECDQFASAFQRKLGEAHIVYSPLLIVVDAMNPGGETSMMLNSPKHPFHGKKIGHDSHVATTVVIGGIIYVFDNHNPHGVPLPVFVHSIKFLSEYAPSLEHPDGYRLDHAELVGRNMVKVFIMEADDARRSGTSWRASLLQQNARIKKAYGIVWDEFSSNARIIPEGMRIESAEVHLPRLFPLDVGSPEFTERLLANYRIMIGTQREMINQQLILIRKTEEYKGNLAPFMALHQEMQETLLQMYDAVDKIKGK